MNDSIGRQQTGVYGNQLPVGRGKIASEAMNIDDGSLE